MPLRVIILEDLYRTIDRCMRTRTMLFSGIKRIIFCVAFLLAVCTAAFATPEYAERSGQGCLTCHANEEGGGTLTTAGLEFAASGYEWPPSGGYRVLGPIRKPVRLGVGFFHLVAAFLWFGTILYVHLMLRPGYASRGLPRGEVTLGLISMAVVGISGVLLTISRIKSFDVLYTSQWGQLLSLKIVFYVVMVSSAIFTVIFIGPKLKQGKMKARIPADKIFDPLTLQSFNGKDGSPVFIAYRGTVYDMTGLKLWKDGIHMKHQSGIDLSEFISKAPHGEEKLESLPVVGTYDPALKPPKTFAQKAFYFVAYMNLVIVFIVLLIIAYWRWGL
jgi:predicted heme/steroid binding protein